jgi:hypothetical protein
MLIFKTIAGKKNYIIGIKLITQFKDTSQKARLFLYSF